MPCFLNAPAILWQTRCSQRREIPCAEDNNRNIKSFGRADRFIIVTNQVGDDGIEYPDETMEYIRQMGLLNSAIAQAADVVIEAVYGVPVYLKGAAK